MAHASSCAMDPRRSSMRLNSRLSSGALNDPEREIAYRQFASPSGGSAGRPRHPIGTAVQKSFTMRLGRPPTTRRLDWGASSPMRESMAVEMLERYGNDPVVVDATFSGPPWSRGKRPGAAPRAVTTSDQLRPSCTSIAPHQYLRGRHSPPDLRHFGYVLAVAGFRLASGCSAFISSRSRRGSTHF